MMQRVVWTGLLAMGVLLAGGCASGGAKMSGKTLEAFVRPLPESNEYVRLLDRNEAVGMRSGLVTLQPGQDCGWHSTDNYEEMLVCLSGAGEVATEGGGRRPLAAPCCAYNPPHTRHCVFNTGTQPLRYVYVVAPAEPAEAQQAHGH